MANSIFPNRGPQDKKKYPQLPAEENRDASPEASSDNDFAKIEPASPEKNSVNNIEQDTEDFLKTAGAEDSAAPEETEILDTEGHRNHLNKH